MTLQRFREWLTLGLIVLLPFHAFMVTVLTKMMVGPGHAPLSSLAMWKEGVLGLVLLIAMMEVASQLLSFSASQRKIDALDLLIIGLLLLGVFVSFFNSSFSIFNSQFIFGFRYDFVPLIAFFILRRVPWSEEFLQRAMKGILGAGVLIAVYGIISFFLPAAFFTLLGYSDLHSLYVPDGALAPFQQIGGTTLRRIQSVMSGPNQLGVWLLMPIAVVLGVTPSGDEGRLRFHGSSPLTMTLFVLLVLVAALILTFSRAAWIGAAVIVGIAFMPVLRSLSRRTVIYLLSSAFCLLVLSLVLFPSILLRAASSRGHIENPLKAIAMMVDHPFGLGLGTAGPASNRTSDACVLLEAGSDASWAEDRPNLCVFVDGLQVQPTDRVCSCPFLPENWYLQIGVEMGWVGLCLYMVLVWMIVRRLWGLKIENEKLKNIFKNSILNSQFSIFLGVSIAALFLHAWEDSAVAYVVWALLAAIL